MRKKVLSVILMIGLVASMIGCGSNEQEKTAVNVSAEPTESEEVENEAVKAAESEETVEITSEGSEDAEPSYTAEDYEEQKDIFVVKQIDSGDGVPIDLTDAEQVDGPFIIPESIDIYSYFFTYAGYTKPDIKVDIIRRIGDWIFIPFAQSSFIVKAEDFDKVAILEKNKNTEEENNGDVVTESPSIYNETPEEVQPEDNDNSGSENVAVAVPEAESQPQTEAPAPATAYSEAEVISIVETALRNAGFRKPEELVPAEILAEFGPTDGMGWGIDDIPMNDPYTTASQIVEGFQFNHWNVYYIENQGSSDGYVHLKLYSGTHK